MSNLFLIILYTLLIYSSTESIIILNSANTSIHQIYGAVFVVVVAICASGIGIIHTLTPFPKKPGMGDKKCPFCAANIPTDAKFCRYCAHDVSIKETDK